MLPSALLLLRSVRKSCSAAVRVTYFQIYMNDGYVLVVMTSILFGAYHWWTGIGNIVEAIFIGILLMLFYCRSGALWPAVLAHYLTDLVDFAL
jgi:uncharacterized protein